MRTKEKKTVKKNDYIPLSVKYNGNSVEWSHIKEVIEEAIEERTRKLIGRHPTSKDIRFFVGIEQPDIDAGFNHETIHLTMLYEREETDYEIKNRLDNLKSYKIERYNTYLKMKKEFKNINSVEDIHNEEINDEEINAEE